MRNDLRKHAWLDDVWPWARGFAFTLCCLVAVVVYFRGCTGDKDDAKRLIESAGYTHVEVGDAAKWNCSDDDSVSNSFTARSPNGSTVRGVVCCGFFVKNCTLRLQP